MIPLTPSIARKLAVQAQRLAEPLPPATKERLLDIMRSIRCLQLDPIRAVDRTQYLVLWSRLGPYERRWLHELTFEDRALFEYWAHAASIVLTEDYPIHAHFMRRYATDPKRKITKWIGQNEAFKRYVLSEIDRRGPLLTKELEDRPEVPITSSGWTNGRSLPYMLDYLWTKGQIMVSNRDGLKRWWDMPARVLPNFETDPHFNIELDDWSMTRHAAERALLSLGIARVRDINRHFVEKRYIKLKQVIDALVEDGTAVPVIVPDWGEEAWYVHLTHYPMLDALLSKPDAFYPRLTLLSPFDHLIRDRDRTELMWNFHYRIEIYVPKRKREYGYYVLPILDGEHLIGRIDSRMDRKTGIYHIFAIYTEAGAMIHQDNGLQLKHVIETMAHFLDAKEIRFEHDRGRLPHPWQTCLG